MGGADPHHGEEGRELMRAQLRIGALILGTGLIAACGTSTPSGPAASPGQSGATSTAAPNTSAAASAAPGGTVEGPGELVLSPADGIDALGGHTASLTEALDGVWSITTTLVSNGDARSLTVERTGEVPGGYPDAGSTILSGGAIYAIEGEECSAAIAGGDAANAFVEPVTALPGLVGASLEKAESIDGIDVNSYTFDGLALGIPDASVATGRVSVAIGDGHVVRYSMAVTGGEDELGEGLSGTLTTSYELSDAGAPPAIDLPPSCPPGRIDFLVPLEATDVIEEPGTTSFTLAGTVSNAVGIVRGGSVIAHWTAGEAAVFDDEAHLAFTAEGLAIDAFFYTVKDGTFVEMVAART